MQKTQTPRNNVEEVMAEFRRTKKLHIKCNTPGCEGELNCMPNVTYKRKFGTFENMIMTWKCRKCVAAERAAAKAAAKNAARAVLENHEPEPEKSEKIEIGHDLIQSIEDDGEMLAYTSSVS